MKTIALIALSTLISLNVYAAERVNGKESLRMCKQAAQETLADDTVQLKFKRHSATSVDSNRYKHWINITEVKDSKKSSKKLLCETSRTGEVLVLSLKDGRWKI